LAEYSIQIQFPESVKHEILTWGDYQIPDDILLDDFTWGRDDDPHVTLLYRLNFSHFFTLQKLLEKENSFEIKLGATSLFKKEYFDVLKIDVESNCLHRITQRLMNEMILPKQYPQYIPHVTLAFLKKNTGDFLVENDFFKDKTLKVDHLCFCSRAGDKIKINLETQNEK
jgi:2'-5' RNA ligase